MKVDIDHWHHSPAHIYEPNMMYIVTASTYQKEHLFRGDKKLRLLQSILFDVMKDYKWELQAWAVFSNHYHFIGKSPENGKTVRTLTQRLHSESSRKLNDLDGNKGRKVWFQYWDTLLTYEKSYYARLNYVHNNPVKHGLVKVASQYPFCSAGWFEVNAKPSLYRKIQSFKYDKVNVRDDFTPVW